MNTAASLGETSLSKIRDGNENGVTIMMCYSERAKKWYERHFLLLRNLVIALNEFADVVRSSINPNYFLFEGKFTIYDSLGTTNEMEEVHYLPKNYKDTE